MQLLSDCLPDYGTEQSWGGYQFKPCILVSSVPSSMSEPWEQLLSGIVGRLDELLNSSLSRLPQIITELYYFSTHTTFRSIQMTLHAENAVIHFSGFAAGLAPTKEIHLVTDLGKESA